MPAYRITFTRSARRELEDLQQSVATRILTRIEALGDEPRPRGSVKLQGSASLWRIRIGDYRVVYDVDDEGLVVDVIVVRHRREAYR